MIVVAVNNQKERNFISNNNSTLAAWRSGKIVGCINEVTLRWARLVLG